VEKDYPFVVNVIDKRSPRYLAVLAMVAGLILLAGWLLRPHKIAQSPPPVPSESELQELTRRAQRRSLASTTTYFSELASDVRPSLGYIASMGSSAIVWDESQLIGGPIANNPASLTVRTASGDRRADATWSRRLPLSFFKTSVAPPTRAPRRATSPPAAGEWVVAVWQTDQAATFAAGNFQDVASTKCGDAQASELMTNIPLHRSMIGGGMFNMDRELLGAILPCSDHIAAIHRSSVDDMLKRTAKVEERLLASYGILLSSFSSDERSYFSQSDGVLVREVWIGTRGEAAGLQAGDVILALNDHAVRAIDDLRPLMAPAAAFELKVQRGSKTQIVFLGPSAAPSGEQNAADLGVIIESPAAAGFQIDLVLPHSRAARAGVQAGDILRRINHVEPRTRAQANRAVTRAASSSMLLEVERDRRRLAIVIPEDAPR
jgi:S1-C subfamily serine protease